MSSQSRLDDFFAHRNIQISLEEFDYTDQLDDDGGYDTPYDLETLDDDIDRLEQAQLGLEALYKETNRDLGRLLQQASVCRLDLQGYDDILEEKGIQVGMLSITPSRVAYQDSLEALGGYAKAIIGGVIVAIVALLGKLLQFLLGNRRQEESQQNEKEETVEVAQALVQKKIDIQQPDFTKLNFSPTDETLAKNAYYEKLAELGESFKTNANGLQEVITDRHDSTPFVNSLIQGHYLLINDLSPILNEVANYLNKTLSRGGKSFDTAQADKLLGDLTYCVDATLASEYDKVGSSKESGLAGIQDRLGQIRDKLHAIKNQPFSSDFKTFYNEFSHGQRQLLQHRSKTYKILISDKMYKDQVKTFDQCRKNLDKLKVGDLDDEVRNKANELTQALRQGINLVMLSVSTMGMLNREENTLIGYLKKAQDIYNEHFQ